MAELSFPIRGEEAQFCQSVEAQFGTVPLDVLAVLPWLDEILVP
jgi:hypothetical protein